MSPMVILNIEDHLPGDAINLQKKGKVNISVKAFGHAEQVPLSKLEIIAHGKVIQEIIPNESEQTNEFLELNVEMDIPHGLWILSTTVKQ